MSASETRKWLEYAQSDLDAARTLLAAEDHFLRQDCYLAQQSAEKALKAALIAQKLEFPFTHDLDRLRNLLSEQWTVKSTFPDLAELTIWAVEARYPADMPEVLERDARRAIELARDIVRLIEGDLPAFSAPEHPDPH